MDRNQLNAIVSEVSHRIDSAGFVCIEAEWADHRILRLYVDKKEGGIDIDGCVQVSHILDAASFDHHVQGSYTLEVSSPGLERPLRKVEDFRSHLGRNVSVKLLEEEASRKYGAGMLANVLSENEETRIVVKTETGDWIFPLAKVQKANLVFDWCPT